MKLDYVLMDPTGNMTILVETPVPAASQPFCAARLLAREPTAEQVGFLSAAPDCDLALRMAGGEFCGNAAMSAAALIALRRGLAEEAELRIRVSGAEAPVPVKLRAQGDGSFSCAAALPAPKGMGEYGGLPLIELPGISHLIATEPMPRAAAEAAVRELCAGLGAEALGLMLLDETAGTLTPLVYVPGADTLFWENSCASGTAAAGLYLAGKEAREITRTLSEPAGSLTVTASPDGAVLLRGTVRLTREDSLCIEVPGEVNEQP